MINSAETQDTALIIAPETYPSLFLACALVLTECRNYDRYEKEIEETRFILPLDTPLPNFAGEQPDEDQLQIAEDALRALYSRSPEEFQGFCIGSGEVSEHLIASNDLLLLADDVLKFFFNN